MNRVDGWDDEVDQLPGFRFHPTDEELVGFYLRRKVDKKAFTIELIKQIDIYKYDPWDLPKTNTVGDMEWYFFCKRGRKYRNSIRPNRVTGSGFWKATGIDRPVYSLGGEGRHEYCIGLKKTLVYYRGSAGKGSKTDWMMHEFRLPTNTNTSNLANSKTSTALQEAEVWTLCRIFKRTVANQKCRTPERKEISTKHNSNDTNPKKCNLELKNEEDFLNFGTSFICHDQEMTPAVNRMNMINEKNQLHVGQLSFITAQASSMAASPSTFSNLDVNEFFRYGNWDEFTSVMEFSMDPFLL